MKFTKQNNDNQNKKKYALRHGILFISFVTLIGITLWATLNQYQLSSTITNPTPTPTAGYTPGVKGIIATINPTETPAPTPTPTPTFEPLTDEPIMGFVFSLPQEIPNTRHPFGLEIVDWLPDSSTEVLVMGAYTLETVNISTGQINVYATTEVPGGINPQPIWLPEAQGVAYLTWNDRHQNLWLGKAGVEGKLLLSDVTPPLIPLKHTQGIAIHNQNNQLKQGFKANGESLTTLPIFLNDLPVSKVGPLGTAYRIAMQPTGNWMAYYNNEIFQFINIETGETRQIDEISGDPTWLWAMDAKWSPDGQKVAIVVAEEPVPIFASHLYIYEWSTATLYKIEDDFRYITDIAWAPDSQHLLFKPVIDEARGRNIVALYFMNILKPTEFVSVGIPIKGLGSSFGGGLSWSPDGQKILLKYANDQYVSLYQIKVNIP